MGEAQSNVFEPYFNRSIKVQSVDQRLTSHAGALLLRDFDHQLGLTESLADQLIDPRNQDRIRYQAVELIRERAYALAMGAKHQDDLDRLAHDTAIKLSSWDRPGEEVLNQRMASQPTQSRLIGWLSESAFGVSESAIAGVDSDACRCSEPGVNAIGEGWYPAR